MNYYTYFFLGSLHHTKLFNQWRTQGIAEGARAPPSASNSQSLLPRLSAVAQNITILVIRNMWVWSVKGGVAHKIFPHAFARETLSIPLPTILETPLLIAEFLTFLTFY